MTNATNTQQLTADIERLVREQLAEIHRAPQQALERAFSAATAERVTVSRPRRKSACTAKRRAPSEVAALGERLYRAVCDHPGESMAVLSGELGASARELHRPMALLRRAGRVRSVGERHATRYFPMVTDSAAAAS